jgi:FG-GAP-like repeat/FG-GAP repeat
VNMPSSLKCVVAATVITTLAACGYGHDDYYGPPYYPGPPVTIPNSIAVADVNGDGVPDLLVATTLDQGLINNPGFANVMLGQTTPGIYSTQPGVGYPTTGTDPSSIAVADLEGSGHLDLVVANYGSGSVTVFIHGSTPGTFQPGVNIVTGGTPNQVAVGSLNGGNPDIVVADASASGNVIVLFHDPANPGGFLAPVMLPTGVTTSAVAIADINGDGHPDIAAATYDSNGNNGAVFVFYQSATSPGTFAAPVQFPAGAQPQAVRIADVNGDGLPDLVVANLGPGTDGTGSAGVSVLLQNSASPGTFLAPVTYLTQSGSVDVAVGDVNGDGKPDLVVANLGPAPTGSVSVLLQNPASPGTFGSATNYPGFGQPLSVAIADLDGNGLADIAVADSSTATVMQQNPGSPGTFAQPVQVGQQAAQ